MEHADAFADHVGHIGDKAGLLRLGGAQIDRANSGAHTGWSRFEPVDRIVFVDHDAIGFFLLQSRNKTHAVPILRRQRLHILRIGILSKVEEECRFRDVAHEVAVAGIQCDADAVALFSPQKLEEFATILEKEALDPNWGSGFIFFHF